MAEPAPDRATAPERGGARDGARGLPGCRSLGWAVLLAFLSYVLLATLYRFRPGAALGAVGALAVPTIVWRRAGLRRLPWLLLLGGVGAALGIWADKTLARPPGTSVGDNLLWIAEGNARWILMAAAGLGAWAWAVSRFVDTRPLRGLAALFLVPTILLGKGWLEYVRMDSVLESHVSASRRLLLDFNWAQDEYRETHGVYAATVDSLGLEAVPMGRARRAGATAADYELVIERADSSTLRARAWHPEMPAPCTLDFGAGDEWPAVQCPRPLRLYELVRWGLGTDGSPTPLPTRE